MEAAHPNQKHIDAYEPVMTQREFVAHLDKLHEEVLEARRFERDGPGAGHLRRAAFCEKWARIRASRENKYNFAKACYDAGKYLDGDPIEEPPTPAVPEVPIARAMIRSGRRVPR